MNNDDCTRELDAAGVEWKPAIALLKKKYKNHPKGKKPPVRTELRKMVKKLRGI